MVTASFQGERGRASICISITAADVRLDAAGAPVPVSMMEPEEARRLANRLMVMAELLEEARADARQWKRAAA